MFPKSHEYDCHCIFQRGHENKFLLGRSWNHPFERRYCGVLLYLFVITYPKLPSLLLLCSRSVERAKAYLSKSTVWSMGFPLWDKNLRRVRSGDCFTQTAADNWSSDTHVKVTDAPVGGEEAEYVRLRFLFKLQQMSFYTSVLQCR